MSLKSEITEYLIKNLNLISNSKKSFAAWKIAIWKNPRENSKCSLALTERGFDLMCKADFKYYTTLLDFDNDPYFNNKYLLWLDRNFECPYFLSNKKMHFFSQKPAVELALFSGDLKKYFWANINFDTKIKTC